MIHDLRSILDGWEYEPGKISVRKIIGRDGREKLQTRVDLGLLQLELTGRPDGQRPHGCESFLEYIEQRLQKHRAAKGNDEGFLISAEECREMRHEAHLFYQRFLSLFVLEDFEGVERDTARNLRLLDLCRTYAAGETDRAAMEQQRAYLIMMNVRAQTYAALKEHDFERANSRVEDGLLQLRQSAEDEAALHAGGEERPELHVLSALRQEVLERMPADAIPRLRWELQTALEQEDYELAAKLRDRLGARTKRNPAA